MDSDIQTLKSIRKNFAAAAATCDKGAKRIVEATTRVIAARRGRKSRFGKALGRLL